MTRKNAFFLAGALGLLVATAAWARIHGSAAMPPAAGTTGPHGIISKVHTDEKVVALTFDDGPDPKYTPALLQLARQKQVKFTFFLVGKNVHAYPDLARQEVADGHAVGNHTWDHHWMTSLSERQDTSELTLCEQELDRACGPHAHLMRPPKGLWNDNTYRAAMALGYPIILWSAQLEHHPRRSAQQLAERMIGLARPGMIILAHDGEINQVADRTEYAAGRSSAH